MDFCQRGIIAMAISRKRENGILLFKQLDILVKVKIVMSFHNFNYFKVTIFKYELFIYRIFVTLMYNKYDII